MSNRSSVSTCLAAPPAPSRPVMQPDRATRRMKLSPHQLIDRVTAADDLFVLEAVEITADGGLTYTRTELEQRNGWTWQRFWLTWRPAERGEAHLAARAVEHGGAVQPVDGARNSISSVRVTVR